MARAVPCRTGTGQYEIANGVTFWVAEERGRCWESIGLQDKGAVAFDTTCLCRADNAADGSRNEAPAARRGADRQARVLIGTWADASWAIDFYRRNGFTLVGPAREGSPAPTYWSIPERQIETSVVLADRRWSAAN